MLSLSNEEKVFSCATTEFVLFVFQFVRKSFCGIVETGEPIARASLLLICFVETRSSDKLVVTEPSQF